MKVHIIRCASCGWRTWMRENEPVPVHYCGPAPQNAGPLILEYTFHAKSNGPGLHPTQIDDPDTDADVLADRVIDLAGRVDSSDPALFYDLKVASEQLAHHVSLHYVKRIRDDTVAGFFDALKGKRIVFGGRIAKP